MIIGVDTIQTFHIAVVTNCDDVCCLTVIHHHAVFSEVVTRVVFLSVFSEVVTRVVFLSVFSEVVTRVVFLSAFSEVITLVVFLSVIGRCVACCSVNHL